MYVANDNNWTDAIYESKINSVRNMYKNASEQKSLFICKCALLIMKRKLMYLAETTEIRTLLSLRRFGQGPSY